MWLQITIRPYEATLTKNLRDAGAIIVAKTGLTELANWVAGAPNPMPALNANNLDAMLTPGAAGAGLAARAGYPIIVVPFGMVPNAPAVRFPESFQAKPAPFGIGFTGTACSEPKLFELAYAFEQATRRRIPPPSTP
jgi:Asp-tRNA(Asn)/Glu-tRNA(Gln) amidotransferase A subunit family amidase